MSEVLVKQTNMSELAKNWPRYTLNRSAPATSVTDTAFLAICLLTTPTYLAMCSLHMRITSLLPRPHPGSGEFGHNPWARERNLSVPMRLQL